MCNNNTSLIIFLIIKILALLILPIIIIFIKKIDKAIKDLLFVLNIALLVLLISLRIFNNNCVISSTINGIKYNKYKEDAEYVVIKSSTEIGRIKTNDIYKTNNNSNVYYFNNVSFPLSNQSITCSSDTVFMKDYGNEITAVSIMASSILDKNIDPIEILDLAKKNNVIDCNKRINIDKLISIVNNKYKLYSVNIDSNSAHNKIKNGEVILAEVNYVEGMNNISCDKDYVVIYKINNDNKYVILNPSKRDKDYICPDNTDGLLTVIKGNNNTFSEEEFNKICSRYIYMGRN